MGYYFLKFLAYPILRLFWLGKIDGLNKIPKKGSFIIAANHKSYLDFVLLFVFVPRKVSFLAAEVFFESRLWKPIMKITNQIKVDRKSANKEGVYKSVDLLFKNGGVLGIFPEGTRSRDGLLHEGHIGAVKFAEKYDVPIFPVGLTNTFKALPPHKKVPRIIRCDINIGDPIQVNINRGDYKSATKKLMNIIANLSGENYGY